MADDKKKSEGKSSEKTEAAKPKANAKRIAVHSATGRRAFVRELQLGPEPIELVVADLSPETKAELVGKSPNPTAVVTVLD